ncbi:MAG: porin family protein [Alphaproteobacteria bacterium]|nr:porin family protein [Alphaproteobacteria bacterium]
MKKILLLAGVASLVATQVSATEYNPYVVARLARVEVKNDMTTIDFQEKLNDDQFGYRFAGGVMVPFCGGMAESVRAEVEYGLLNKTHNNIYSNVIQSKLQTVFANVYYDLDTGTSFNPYIGVGLGYARIDENNSGREAKEENFAYNVGVGVSYNLSYKTDLELGYRFTDYGKIKQNGDDYAKRSYDSQEILVGFRHMF